MIKIILEKGKVQDNEVSPQYPFPTEYPPEETKTETDLFPQSRERSGDKNIADGPSVAH